MLLAFLSILALSEPAARRLAKVELNNLRRTVRLVQVVAQALARSLAVLGTLNCGILLWLRAAPAWERFGLDRFDCSCGLEISRDHAHPRRIGLEVILPVRSYCCHDQC